MLLCLVFLYFIYMYIKDYVFKRILESICISSFTALVVGVINILIERNDFEEAYKELLQKNLPFLYDLNKRGLIFFGKDFPLDKDEYKNDFLLSNQIVLIMNDGQRFINSHIDLFRKRFSKKEKKSVFIFLNPDQEDSISVLTRKNGHDDIPDYYVRKIKDFSDELRKYGNEYVTHEINVGYHNYFTTMGVLLTDNYAMISLYRISPGKVDVPNLVFKKNSDDLSEYEKIKTDVNKVVEQAKTTSNMLKIENKNFRDNNGNNN